MPHLFQATADSAVPIDKACELLAGISRATFYRIKFFETRRVPMSEGRVGIRVSDINLYLRLQAEKPPRRRKPKAA